MASGRRAVKSFRTVTREWGVCDMRPLSGGVSGADLGVDEASAM